MPWPISGVVPIFRAAGGWAWNKANTWRKQRAARAAALQGADLTRIGSVEELVERGLLRMSSVDVAELPGSVDPIPFGDWLRDPGNRGSFVDIFVAQIGGNSSEHGDATRQLESAYTQRAGQAPARFPEILRRVVSYIVGPFSASESGRRELDEALARYTAARMVSAPDAPARERVAQFAKTLLQAGKHSWKMPPFVAPLTLDASQEIDGEPRPTTPDELIRRVDTGAPLALCGPGGIGKTTFLLELAERCLAAGDRTPLFVDASAWAQRGTSLIRYLVDQPAAHAAAVSTDDLMSCASSLVLLINGWNEMPAAAKVSCRNDLIQLRVTAPALAVVTCSRTKHDSPGLEGTSVVHVRGLAWKGQLEIIRAELPADSASALIELLAKNTPLRHAARSPLILRGAIAQAQKGLRPDTSVLELLGAAVATFEADPQRSAALLGQPIESNHRPYLQALARHLTDQGLTRCDRADAVRVMTSASRELLADGIYLGSPSSGSVLETLANHHLLHVDDDSARFAHQRFQEFFAAEWFRKEVLGGTDGALLRSKINDTRWEEVLGLSCEHLSTSSKYANLRSRLVAAAFSVDLGVACQCAGDSGFTTSDDRELRAALVAAVHSMETSERQSIRDLATTYQVASGFEEFAEALWKIIENTDRGVRLRVHRRAETAIGIDQLGADVAKRISSWPPARRAELMHDLASNPRNYSLVLQAARSEPSEEVRAAAIASLFWNYPASEDSFQAWLSAPPQIQAERDVLSHVLWRVGDGYAPEAVRVRAREIVLNAGSPSRIVEWVCEDPANATPEAIDALVAHASGESPLHNIADAVPILQQYAPDRLLTVARKAAFAPREAHDWARDVLSSAGETVCDEVLADVWESVQRGDLRRVHATIVGPLATRAQIARGVDICATWELNAPRPLSNAEYERLRAAQQVLAQVNEIELLNEVFDRGPQASYAESLFLLQIVLNRIGRELGGHPKENVWTPTAEQVQRLVELFRDKVDASDPHNVAVMVYLSRIASHSDIAKFIDLVCVTCQRYLDAWADYDERARMWDRRKPDDRLNNPAWDSYLLPVLQSWGLSALPFLIEMLNHPAADHFVPYAIAHVSASSWISPGVIHRTVSSDMRDGKARRIAGRAMRQPDEAYQHTTDEAASRLGRQLKQMVFSLQGPPLPKPYSSRAAEYKVGHLAKLVAIIPSPFVLEPVLHALASGPIHLSAQIDCIRSLLRQGARVEDLNVLSAIDASVHEFSSEKWLDQSDRYVASNAYQFLTCAAPTAALSHPRAEHLAAWQKFAGARDVIRALGSSEETAMWPILIEAADAVEKDQEGRLELARAAIELLSVEVIPEFLELIRSGRLFRWVGDGWHLERLTPKVTAVFGTSAATCQALLEACEVSPSPLASVFAAEAVGSLQRFQPQLVDFVLKQIDLGRLKTRTAALGSVVHLFSLSAPERDSQTEVSPLAQNRLRSELYRRANQSGEVALVCKDVLARIEVMRWEAGRPSDEPRHPKLSDGTEWTRALLSQTAQPPSSPGTSNAATEGFLDGRG